MRKTLNVIRSEREGSIPVVRKVVSCHQSHRFFTRCHVAASRFSHKAFLPPFRMTIGRKGVIMGGTLIVIRSECEGSMPVVRKVVRCHQSHRFFTRCHVAASRFSHKAFLPPFRMTIGRKGVIMGGTLIVIRSECEGSMPVVRKVVRCHQSHRFFTRCHVAASRFSHKAFLPPFRMTIGGRR